MPAENSELLLGSFRDPRGFVFLRDGVLYRHLRPAAADDYARLMQSGLYDALRTRGWIIAHEEADPRLAREEGAWKVLMPEKIPFVSYPYEWCFGQWKAAALLTLRLQKTALKHGMSLRDASAFNIQFLGTKPVFIDTLSFGAYEEGKAWNPYGQFCRHFLAPLFLLAFRDARLGLLLREHMDGVPLDLADSLLPLRTRFRWGALVHLHLHARFQRRRAGAAAPAFAPSMTRSRLMALLDSLEGAIENLRWNPRGTWADYYATDGYAPEALESKRRTVVEFLDALRPETVWDLGANTGLYSRLAAEGGARTVVSLDGDAAAVEKHYRACVETGQERILPLVMDLVNPSPDLGWHHRERMSLEARGPADAALALALVHHLAFTHNVPFGHLARFFASLCRTLIVEFVPKTDRQVRRLLAAREDIFPDYTQAHFEREFARFFTLVRSVPIAGTERVLYCMQTR